MPAVSVIIPRITISAVSAAADRKHAGEAIPGIVPLWGAKES
jgi:hypothetical protein